MKAKKWLLKPPQSGDLTTLLMAWRVWIAGAVIGAAATALLYLFAPPPYRAQATVLVDQNVEQVIPQERSDLLINTYLQRETDKLVELAWSDQVLSRVSSMTGIPVAGLRSGRLSLSQPADGGWHFLANADNSADAALAASAWANSFVQAIQEKPAGISALLEINYTQAQDLPVNRAVSMGVYIFCGAVAGAALLALGLLFFNRKDA